VPESNTMPQVKWVPENQAIKSKEGSARKSDHPAE
jgi:hypothetical protein